MLTGSQITARPWLNPPCRQRPTEDINDTFATVKLEQVFRVHTTLMPATVCPPTFYSYNNTRPINILTGTLDKTTGDTTTVS